MTPRIATVLSARPWESALVAAARDTAVVRLVLRAYRPEDVDERCGEIDIVVAGAETSWVTPARVASWRRAGLGVVGIHPAGDAPARDLLMAGGADEVLSDDVPAVAILQTARLLRPPPAATVDQSGTTVAVTGGRGAPGRTEIALALAWNWARRERTVLIDLDIEAPALAVRLGRPPRPDVSDAADAVRATGILPADAVQRVGPLSLVTGSHRPGEPPLRDALAEDVVDAASGAFAIVVSDVGPAESDDRILKRADHAVLVADASAVGLVRAARVAAVWSGPPPALVLNRVPRSGVADLVQAARRWTGLEPAAVIRERKAVREAAAAARPPERRLRRALASLEVPVAR